MFSLCSITMKTLHRGFFFIDAAVMWALEPLEMTIYIYIYVYIHTYRYTSIAFQSAARQININYLPKAYMAPILASKKTFCHYIRI